MHGDIRLVVIEGASGTGKSTLARTLQERLLPQQWLHFSVDTVLYGLPPSTLDSINLRNDWSAVDTGAIARSAYGCVQALLDQGQRVIFDCVVMTERRAREMLTALQVHRPLLVRLTCEWEETRRRTLERGDRTVQEAEHGHRVSGRCLAVADVEIDTTQRTAIEVAELVVPVIEDSAARVAWAKNMARLGTGM